MTSENPFNPGTPSRPDSFVGRDGHIARLEAAVFATRDQALVSIFGQRRIGKTSLLWCLKSRWEERDQVRVLLFDGLEMQSCPPESWLRELAQRIGGTTEEPGSPSIWEHLKRLLSSTDSRIVLLIDEFDALASQGAERFDGSFFASLRALLTTQDVLGKLTLLTTTQRDLDASTWSEEMGPGSPFANISGMQEKLGLFSEREARALLNKGRDFLSEEDIGFLRSLAGPHPHFLQVAGSVAWLVKQTPEADFEDAVKSRFMFSAQPVYRSILRALSGDVCEDLYVRAVLGRGSIERERKLREDLLINTSGEIYSEGLRAYCLRDEDALKVSLRKSFRKLPRALRRLLREHSYSRSRDQEVPEDQGFLLREFGWLDADYKIPRLVQLWAPQIMEEEGDA